MRKLALLCSILSITSAVQAQQATPPAQGAAPVAPPIAPIAEPLAPAPSQEATAAAPAEMPVANPNARAVRDFQGEEITMVLRLLARQAGINIIVSDLITGTINMRVENLTPMETIRVIVDAKGLDLSQTNNVYFIKTSAEKAKEPTEAGSYTFSYAHVNEAMPLIATQIQSGIKPYEDLRTNTVFYRDYKSNMANLALFFESIDRPTQQVMIEARLVEVNANPKQSYGINWGGVLGGASEGKTFSFGGTTLATVDPKTGIVTPPTIPNVNNIFTPSSLLLSGAEGSFGNQALGQIAILTAPQLSATLRLMNEDSDTEFLANPRIVTANNLKAKIKITRKQPIPKLKFNEQTATSTFDSFDEKEFGNTLEVTPTINKDSFVTMMVKPEITNKVADQAFQISGATVTSPIIDTRSLESNVLIKSGDTLAIGGLLQDENTKARTKVPILGDIPIIGYAFQERLNARSKRNLLVFITPTIIKQGYGTGLENQINGLKNIGDDYADPNGWRNNARGAVRVVPTSNRPLAADYPKPGIAPAPVKTAPVRTSIKTVVPAAPKAAPSPSPKASPKPVSQKLAQKSSPEYKITVPQREE